MLYCIVQSRRSSVAGASIPLTGGSMMLPGKNGGMGRVKRGDFFSLDKSFALHINDYIMLL